MSPDMLSEGHFLEETGPVTTETCASYAAHLCSPGSNNVNNNKNSACTFPLKLFLNHRGLLLDRYVPSEGRRQATPRP